MDHEMVSRCAGGDVRVRHPRTSRDVPAPPGAAVPHLYYCDPFEGIGLPYGVGPSRRRWSTSPALRPKERMLACHASQREWLRAHHGMDEYLEAMQPPRRGRGKQIGAKYAEAFVQHRGHSYPQDDLLADSFPPLPPGEGRGEGA